MTRYIDDHKGEFGVEPICRVLQFAPATYYAASSRPASARQRRDDQLKVEVGRVWEEHRRVYADKVGTQLKREGPGAGSGRPRSATVALGGRLPTIPGLHRQRRRRAQGGRSGY